MDLAATHSRGIIGNHFGNNTTIHQGDNHYYSPNDKAREDEDTKCLTHLRTTDPRDDKTRIEDTKGGLFKNSYRWILEHSDFRKWRDDEHSRLLWIKGDPGKGKTMLLCGIVNELSSETRLEDQKANTLLSYFFCQATDERINSATAVLRGLIYLIVEQQPLLISHIQEKYKHGGEAIFKDVNAWTALSEIFSNILNDASLERTYIIIDALDECVTDLPKLLDFISTKSTSFARVKWIVSSRNWLDIEERLDSATQQMRLCLELNEKSISTAVDAYIKHQVDSLAQKKKYNAITEDAVYHHLSSNANNTFLWVALVCQNIEKISLRNTLLRLNEFPPGLDSLYERMVQKIQSLKDNDVNFCFRILATVLLVYRPVTLAELGSLVESPEDNPADAELIHKAIGLCGSLLTVRDSRVYVIHQSAKDYLSDKAVSIIFPSSSANVHSTIFARSLQAMSATLRRNIYNLYPPGLLINEFKAPDPDPLAAIRYSCVYWIDHFCDMHNSNSQSQDQVDHKYQAAFLFLQKYFLYWLEALSHMGYIEAGVLSIARLEYLLKGKSFDDQIQELTPDLRWFYPFRLKLKNLLGGKPPDRQSPDCRLLELAEDSRRFIRQNSSVIADTPLQVYTSALIFSPLNSLIRKMFKEEEPQWLKVKPIVEYNWSPYLQTLKGHSDRVNSAAFSADNRYLASGSRDSTIKIWDMTTGKERQTLYGHRASVQSVAFSEDGRYLASGSGDGTVKIWDTTTGKERQTLKGHRGWVNSVAFSADGRYLASGSRDSTIKIWDATTGKERQTLYGHRASVQSVAFSADSRYLASGSNNGTIKIWDITIGKEWQTLEGHGGWVESVAFSIDSRYLASGSGDATIKIWDTTTGKERQTLKGHRGWVNSVAFSADGRYLASGSSDDTIKIWGATTGKERQTLKGHSGSVLSVTFSADSRYLASGSRDNTIKIWDATVDKEWQIPYSPGPSIKLVAFSADGRCLASGSRNGTIKLWDATTGKERQTLKGHSRLILSVTFSTDSRYLASGSGDDTIKIWDVTTGKERQTLYGHSLWVTSVAFSADSRYLASGSRDNTIKIWDMTTGKERQTLYGHRAWVQSVAFSADGRYLASGSDNGTIKIWDATTGKERQTLEGHGGSVLSVALSADGHCLASGSSDNIIKIWDATTGKEQQTLKGHSDRVNSVAFSADSRYLASGSRDSTIKIWDAITGKERQTLKGYGSWVNSVAFSADGHCLASGSNSTIKIWDVTTGKERQTLKGHGGWVKSVALSADGHCLASGSDNSTIKIWDAITGKERQTLKGHSGLVESVAFSADGHCLASGSSDNTIKIWDATTGKEQQTLYGHGGCVKSVAFSADGRYLASGLNNGTIKIWDTTMGKERQTLGSHRGWVKSVAFSADGRYFASGSDDNIIKIWDATTGKERQTLKGHSGSVESVAFSADRRYLASGSRDSTIKIWDVTTGKEQQTFKVNATIYTISFDDATSYLHTEIGSIKLGIEHRTEDPSTTVAQALYLNSDPAQDQDQRRLINNNSQKVKHYGWGISTDKCWITWNMHNILWLPPEYQPSTSAVWHYAPPSTSPQVPLTDVAIALGNGLGRVVVFRMSGSGP